MVLDGLAASLKNTLRKIANAPFIDANLIKEVVRDIQRALLQADVNVKLALAITKEIERKALTEKPPAGMSSRNHVVKIVYNELLSILGKSREVGTKEQVIMMVGLYGQGKTTTSGKLARYFHKRGIKTGLIAADVHRPAAMDQLLQISEQVNVPIHLERGEKDPVKIVKNGLEKFKNYGMVIIDTSGRHGLEADLIEEMEMIAEAARPTERILVIDATVGQQAGPQARAFHDAVKISGVIITKMDGTAKAGGALSAVQETKAPVLFIGTGEHLDELERFEPPSFISRMLGMGDLKALMEKAQGVMSEEEAEEVAKDIMSGRFNLKLMYKQMEMLTGMGALAKLKELLPFGFSDRLTSGQMEASQKQMRQFKVIMDSMTDAEMEDPKLLKHSRIQRIARGAGVETKEVKALLKYYEQVKRAAKGFTSDRKMRRYLMKQMGDQGGE